MLEMNEFEKEAKKIIEKKDEDLFKKIEFIYYLFAIISIPICLFCFSSNNLVKTVGRMLFVIISFSLVTIPLYFLLKFIMLRSDKEYKIAIEILKNYEEKTMEIQNQEKENIENIKKLEEYSKKLKK